MANHGATATAAAALLIIASLLVAVTVADARIAVQQRDMISGDSNIYAAKDAKPVPALVCNKVRAVQADETCASIEGRTGLSNEQFLGFNPNISCAGILVGQWVCLDAVAA